jgi:large subunit ribosomal protein L17
MRHRVAGRELSRTSEHRIALRRNMAQSLIEHETISTTIQKAKEVKPFVEKLITLAKRGKLEHRRRAISLLGNRDIIKIDEGEPTRKGTVVGKLFSDLGPRYLNRAGGYTRIIHLAQRRLGDNGQLVLLQLLGADEPVKREGKVVTKRSSDRKRKETVRNKAAKEAKKTAKKEQPAAEAGSAETPNPAPEAENKA